MMFAIRLLNVFAVIVNDNSQHTVLKSINLLESYGDLLPRKKVFRCYKALNFRCSVCMKLLC